MSTADSHNATSTRSCFSGIFRRIMCTGSLPTHPSDSDHASESDIMQLNNKTIVESKGQGTPGVVARLMGLESLPEINWIPNDSINFKSRSVRSADYFPHFDHLSQESQHRRVKTSVSFREIPTFLHQQNEDLLVVCFDRGENNNVMVQKMVPSSDNTTGFQEMRKVKRSSGNTKQRIVVKKKKDQENKKKNLEVSKRTSMKENNILPYYNKSNEVYIRSSPRMKKKKPTKLSNEFCQEVSMGMKHAKSRENRRKIKKTQLEVSSSSTGSTSDSYTTTSVNSRNIVRNPNPKKHSMPKIDKVEYPCLENSIKRLSSANDDQEVTSRRANDQMTKSSDGLMKSYKEVEFYIQKLMEVCWLNEEDTKSCNDWPWIKSEVIKFDDYEDICSEFEHYLLEMLVQQVVDEL